MQKVLNGLPKLEKRTWYVLALTFFLWSKLFATILTNAIGSFVMIPLGIIMLAFSIRKKRIGLNMCVKMLILSLAFLALANITSGQFEFGPWARLGTIMIFMLVAGTIPKDMDKDAARKERKIIATTFVCLMLPFFVLAIISVYTGSLFSVPGVVRYIGIQSIGNIEERIWILGHPNIAGRMGIGCMLFSIYCLHAYRSRWAKAFFAFAMVVFALGMIHTQSRTCNIMFAVLLGALSFRWVYIKLSGKAKGIIAGLAVCIVVAVIAMLMVNAIYAFDIEVASKLHPEYSEGVTGKMRGGAHDALDAFDDGRDLIWKAGITYLKDNPSDLVFGMGTGSIMKKIVADTGAETWDYAGTAAHLHNSYLEALARGGILFVLCILVYLFALIKPCLMTLVDGDSERDRGAYIFPIMVAVLLLNGLMEEVLFTGTRPFSMFFYFAAGHTLFEYGRIRSKANPVKLPGNQL